MRKDELKVGDVVLIKGTISAITNNNHPIQIRLKSSPQRWNRSIKIHHMDIVKILKEGEDGEL